MPSVDRGRGEGKLYRIGANAASARAVVRSKPSIVRTCVAGMFLASSLRAHQSERRCAMGVYEDLQRFIAAHEQCGEVTRTAQPPTPKGYRIKVACPCGDVFERWVTPEAARYDLVHSSLLASSN
jgi:hypothetical protein